MKLITLNIWGGRVGDALPEFFSTYKDVDIFCFQEVFKLLESGIVPESIVKFKDFKPDTDLFNTLKKYLISHEGYFCQTFKEAYGIAIFLKPHVRVVDHGEILVANGDWEVSKGWVDSDRDRKAHWMELEANGKRFQIINTHLTHRPEGKMDSPKRIQQSNTIAEFIEKTTGTKILAGDFNLLPNTQSVKIIEETGMKNLVKEYGVPSTRTKLYRRFKDGPKFADYIFVSQDIQVKGFKVLSDIVSDHSPLFLEF